MRFWIALDCAALDLIGFDWNLSSDTDSLLPESALAPMALFLRHSPDFVYIYPPSMTSGTRTVVAGYVGLCDSGWWTSRRSIYLARGISCAAKTGLDFTLTRSCTSKHTVPRSVSSCICQRVIVLISPRPKTVVEFLRSVQIVQALTIQMV